MAFKFDDVGTSYTVPYLKRGTKFYGKNGKFHNATKIFVKSEDLMNKILEAMKEDFWKVNRDTDNFVELTQADHLMVLSKRYEEE